MSVTALSVATNSSSDNRAVFNGYFGVIPENMAVPVALFMSEAEAIKYANGAEVRKYLASASFSEVFRQCCRNP
jgi:hypothetical protein